VSQGIVAVAVALLSSKVVLVLHLNNRQGFRYLGTTVRCLKMFSQVCFLGCDEIANFAFQLLRRGLAVVLHDVTHQGRFCDGTIQTELALVSSLLKIKDRR
jgi:hypothetical protein